MNISSLAELNIEVDSKQDTLVSGTNIKSINGGNVLGVGDLVITDSTKLPLAGGSLTGALNEARATVISHATTADIWGALGNQINWTGTATTTIFPNAPQAGAERTLICAGACSFTAGANMLIDGVASGQSVTCAANDTVIVRAISTTQFKLSITKYIAVSTATPYILIRDERANNVAGDYTLANSWITRTLNTKVVDTASIATLSNNTVTLPAGTYRFESFSTTRNEAGNNKCKLVNVTDSIEYPGMNASTFSTTADTAMTYATVRGYFTISSSKVFRLDHKATVSSNVSIPINFSIPEIYTELSFWKVG